MRHLATAIVFLVTVTAAAAEPVTVHTFVRAETDTAIRRIHDDGSLTDIFALQDKVTSQIVAQLQVTLTPDEQRLQVLKGTDNPDAYDAYLRARPKSS